MAALNITTKRWRCNLIVLCLVILQCNLWLVESLPPPHARVLEVHEEEKHLPPHFKSPALQNPHLRHILPLTSLLHKGEELVYDRPSDEVSRDSIVTMLTHAGFRRRQPQFDNHNNDFIQYHEQAHPNDFFNDLPQDLLQHL